jgi:putative Holliday junction resolvase
MMDINDIKNHINNKSRLIGVDMGSKRVGLSISDENRKIATPLKTVNYENIQILVDELKKIANENNVHAIIFGNPKNMDGTEGSSSQSVKDKVKLISEKIQIPIFLWDERLSTVGAFNLSSELDVNVTKRVKNIDKNAAAFILQGVLDFLNN